MRKPIILAIAGAAVLLAWGAYNYTDTTKAASENRPVAQPAVPVTSGIATARDMPVYVRGLGTVQAFNTVTIKSRADGQIVKVDFREGQEVKAGDLLFEIDPRPYQAALAQAQANKQKDQASLASAQADLYRDAQLLARDFATRQAYDQQKATVGQLQASIKADEAQIETAQLNLQYSYIRSPIDGRTGARLVDVGNLVHATDNTGLVTITQLHPIFVSFTAPQEQFDAIRESEAKGPVTAEAYGAHDDQKLATGQLSLIDNQIEQSTGTIHLKAEFANDDRALWPGAFVNMRLVVGTRKNAVTVPARTVLQGPNGDYVYVIKPDMTVRMQPVKVFETEQDLAVIASGLTAGEKVVVDGQYRLDKGTKVSDQSATNKPGA